MQVGQRVATGGTFGVWAEYFIAPAAGLIPVAEGATDEVAAQLVAMPFSALALLDWLELSEGDWIIQNAANGAVGRLLAQLAPSRGINVIGLVRRDAGVEELAAQGIERIVSTESDGWQDRVAELTGGAKIVAGVDSVGGDASNDVRELLTRVTEGTISLPVEAVYPFDEVQAAKANFVAGRKGKIMLRPSITGNGQRRVGA